MIHALMLAAMVGVMTPPIESLRNPQLDECFLIGKDAVESDPTFAQPEVQMVDFTLFQICGELHEGDSLGVVVQRDELKVLYMDKAQAVLIIRAAQDWLDRGLIEPSDMIEALGSIVMTAAAPIAGLPNPQADECRIVGQDVIESSSTPAQTDTQITDFTLIQICGELHEGDRLGSFIQRDELKTLHLDKAQAELIVRAALDWFDLGLIEPTEQ